MKVTFLELIHADTAGHLKYENCVPHLMQRAWWLNWRRDLKLFIRCCVKCEGFHRGPPPKQAKLQTLAVGSPGERWSIDLTGPHCMSNGYKYMLTAVCMFSKFGVVVPLRSKEAHVVARAIVEHIFLKWGLCHEILTDQGSEFEAELLKELLSILGVVRLRTSGYRPQTNGVCEVWHRTLNSMLAKIISDNQKDWSEWISYVTFCYNATTHSATGFAPFFIFTGRTPLWNVDLILPDVSEGGRRLPEYTAEVVERLERASKFVRQNLRAAAESASKWYQKDWSEWISYVTFCYNATTHSATGFAPFFIFTGRTPLWNVDLKTNVTLAFPCRLNHVVLNLGVWSGYTILGGSLEDRQSGNHFFRTEGVVVKKLNDATYVVNSRSWKNDKIVHVDKLKPLMHFAN